MHETKTPKVDYGARLIWATSPGLDQQWGGLHSLSGKKKKKYKENYIKHPYTSNLENG